MNNKSIFKNYIYNLSYQLLVIILPLITTPYVSRVLGAKGIGTYSYTNSITQYFILFGAIGLNLYGQREIAYKQNNKKEYSRVFKELAILRAITLSISIIAFFFLGYSYTKYSIVFYIQIIDVLASIIDISWLFQGLEDFKKIVIRNFIVKLLGTALIFTIVKSTNDLYLYVAIYSVTLFLGNLSMWLYLPKTVVNVRIKELNIKKHLRPAIMLFIPQIATSLYTLLDKTMIGVLTGNDAEVAYYEQSQKIIKLVLTIITSLGTVMMPRIANTFANENHEQITKYMSTTFNFVFILSLPLTIGLIGISHGFVPWFFGEGYDKVVLNMMIIAPIIIFIGISNVIGTQYLLPTNRQKEYTLSVVGGSIINFILNICLIPSLYSYGAAIATIVAELGVTAIQMYYVRKDFDLEVIFKRIIKYLIASLIMLAVIVVLSQCLSISILSTVIEVILGGMTYFIVLIILKDEFLKNSLDMVLRKIKK